jgi:DNA-binding transcriptional LysR family regulator
MTLMNEMDLRDLRYFEVFATIGHLGRAAERLGRTQPALSKCIDRLESRIGNKLFESLGRVLRPTEVGEVLLEQAKIMRRMMDDSAHHPAEHAHGAVGTVRFGVSPAAAVGTLPRLLQRLLLERPQIRANLIIGSSDRLRAAGTADRLDHRSMSTRP